jgi:hypothetical protein
MEKTEHGDLLNNDPQGHRKLQEWRNMDWTEEMFIGMKQGIVDHS